MRDQSTTWSVSEAIFAAISTKFRALGQVNWAIFFGSSIVTGVVMIGLRLS